MTRTKWIVVCFAILVAVVSGALSWAAQAPAKEQGDGWKSFTSKKGGLTVAVPPGSTTEEKDQSLTVTLKGGKDTYQ